MSIVRHIDRHFMISKMMPAIQEKMPDWKQRTMCIQQDSARLRVIENNVEVMQAVQTDRKKILFA